MTSTVLNRVGLVLGIAGVLIIFRWGPPQPQLEEGVGIGMEDGTRLEDGRTVAEHNADVHSLRATHERMSQLGLVLVGLGFGAQLVATC